MRAKRFLFAVLLNTDLAVPTSADEFRPAYLQLTQIDAETYGVLWKVPALETGFLRSWLLGLDSNQQPSG